MRELSEYQREKEEHYSDKTKAIYLTCKASNTSNLCKHLQGHPDRYNEFVEKESNKEQLQSNKKKDNHK